jgi:acid phosphatase type 7
MKNLLAVLVINCLLVSASFAQQLLRGPYQQKQTSTSINIKWRTDISSDAKVYYGTDMNNLNLVAEQNILIPDHEVEVTGLQPYTKYYYRIESSGITLSGPGADHYFHTAPVPGTVQPIRIWAIGDFGKGNNGQKESRESYVNFTGNTHTDVWLWLGDNAYNDGTDQEFQNKVFESTYGFNSLFTYMHFYPIPGNHDYNSVCGIPCFNDPLTHGGPYYQIVSVHKNGEAGGVPSGTELYYSYDYGNVHFVALNSELGSPNSAHDWIGAYTSAGAQNSPMLAWLRQDLAANNKPFVIAYWHQPPFSKGSHDSDDLWEIYMKGMRENVIPILEEYGVDIVLNGHSHVYERSYLINGHYGRSNDFNPAVHLVDGTSGNEALGEAYIKYTDGPEPNKGTVYVISGNGGSSTSNPPFANTAHPVMYFNDGGSNVFGTFIMDVHGDTLRGQYLTSEGQIKDQFTIIKQSITGIPNSYEFFNKVKNVKVMPNPFKDKTTIQFNLQKEAEIEVQIFSLDGKQVHQVFRGRQKSGKCTIALDAAKLGLTQGKYILRISDGVRDSFESVIKVE